MTLNDNVAQTVGASRERVAEDLLEELTTWSPKERMGAFRTWLSGQLSLIHLHVLTVLEAHGPLPMSRLAEALDVSVASATGIVDRMEQRGLVERRHQEDDRRVVLVHRTPRGDEVFQRLARHRRDRLARLLGKLSDDELRAFLIGVRALRAARRDEEAHEQANDEETEQAPPDPPHAVAS